MCVCDEEEDDSSMWSNIIDAAPTLQTDGVCVCVCVCVYMSEVRQRRAHTLREGESMIQGVVNVWGNRPAIITLSNWDIVHSQY